MSERSKKSRRNRRKNKNRLAKNVKGSGSEQQQQSTTDDCEQPEAPETPETETPTSLQSPPNDMDQVPSFDSIPDVVRATMDDGYTVESPETSVASSSDVRKCLQNALNSKSLDCEEDPSSLSIVELSDMRSDEERSIVEVVVSEAESDLEWETKKDLAADVVPEKDIVVEQVLSENKVNLSPQSELDLRQFLRTLNLPTAENPNNPNSNQPPERPPDPPKEALLSENDMKVRKAQKKAAIEEYLAQRARPRFLDIIDEEGSSINSRSSPMLQDFKYIDDLEDDVFLGEKKLETKECHPKDYLARRREARRMQECRLVGAKIIESDFEEGCGDWTLENVEKQIGAEVVYLEDSSSSTSENNETLDDVDSEPLLGGGVDDERVSIKTPIIELTNQCANLMPNEEATKDRDSRSDTLTPERAFAANEELVESLENLSVPAPASCNEVIIMANDFVDELPIVTEVLNDSKVERMQSSDSIVPRGVEEFVELGRLTEYSRHDSSSSVCSSTSHGTAKYNPLGSSLTDIDAITQDDSSPREDTTSTTTPTDQQNINATNKHDTKACAPVAGGVSGGGGGGGGEVPSTLKELCVDKIASLKYGDAILQELASVSQSLSDFANEALTEEVSKRTSSKMSSEREPPPVAPPRQSSFKMRPEEPSWVGLQSPKNPSLVAYLSPAQKMQIERSKNFGQDEASELIDMHCKYANRRGYNETIQEEKVPESYTQSNNIGGDKTTMQPPAPAPPDTGNRLLAIIRDPAVNPNAAAVNPNTSEEAEKPRDSSTFDFMETLRSFEDLGKNLEQDACFRSWTKRDENVKETLEVTETYSTNKNIEKNIGKVSAVSGGNTANGFSLPKHDFGIPPPPPSSKPTMNGNHVPPPPPPPHKPNKLKPQERIIRVSLEKDEPAVDFKHKSNERIVRISLEKDEPTKPKEKPNERIINITVETDEEPTVIWRHRPNERIVNIENERLKYDLKHAPNERIIKITMEDESESSAKQTTKSNERIINITLEKDEPLACPKPEENTVRISLEKGGESTKTINKPNERIVNITLESNEPKTDAKPKETKTTTTSQNGERIVKVLVEESNGKSTTFEDPKREMQHLHNRRGFILDDPIFESIPKHDFGGGGFTTKRRSSLPRDLHEQQMEYIMRKEKEIEEQIRQLEQEKKMSFDEESNSFSADKYHISRQRDVATYQSGSMESLRTPKMERKSSLTTSEAERFRDRMYNEYMDKVAEREERKQHRVIKIKEIPPSGTQTEVVLQSSSSSGDLSNKIEQEFIARAKERWEKMGFSQEDLHLTSDKQEEQQQVTSRIRVLDGTRSSEVTRLPSHLREFVEFASNGDESGEPRPEIDPSMLFLLSPFTAMLFAAVKRFW